MSISLPTAELLALCLSTFLYGLFFALVLITTAVMSYRSTDDVRRQRMKILPVLFAMLAVATMHFIVAWVRGIHAFANQQGKSATAFYADISSTTSLLRMICLCLQATMGDVIIIWRLYIVYGKRLRIIIPAVFLVVAYMGVGTCVVVVTERARPDPDADTNIFNVAKTFITAYFSLTMTSNVLLSGAIALRIYLAGKPLHRGSRPHWLIILALVESCALYTFNLVAALATFQSDSFAQYAAVDSIVPIVGISFSLVVLQIRFHVGTSHGPRLASDGHVSAVWRRPDGRPFGADLEDPKNPLQPIRMTINVSNETTGTDLQSHDDTIDADPSSMDMKMDKLAPV